MLNFINRRIWSGSRFMSVGRSHVRWPLRAGRELFWIILGQGMVVVGAMVGVRLLTSALRPAQYGELALAMTLAILLSQVVFGPLMGATLRFYAPAQQAGQILPFVSAARGFLRQATALVAALIAGVVVALFLSDHRAWAPLAVFALVFALLSGYGSVLDSVQNAARQRVIVAWHNGLAVWLRLALAIALVELLGAYSYIAMTGYAVAAAIVFGSQYFFFRRHILAQTPPHSTWPSSDETDHWTVQIRRYAWPNMVWAVFTWLQISSDRWALQHFEGTREVGLYAVLFQLGYYPITILSTVVMQMAMPILFSRVGDASNPGRVAATHRLNRLMILATLMATFLGVILAWLLHSFVFSVLAAPEYRRVSPLLPLVVLGAGLFATGQMASLTFFSSKDTKSLMAPKVGTALLGVIANIIGAWLLGLVGIVIGGIVFGAAYCLWLVVMSERLTERQKV